MVDALTVLRESPGTFVFICFLFGMMTSSNGNIFRVAGHLCGEFTGPDQFPAQRPVTRSFDVFLICAGITGWVNNRGAGDLRRSRAHYDVNVMVVCSFIYAICQQIQKDKYHSQWSIMPTLYFILIFPFIEMKSYWWTIYTAEKTSSRVTLGRKYILFAFNIFPIFEYFGLKLLAIYFSHQNCTCLQIWCNTRCVNISSSNGREIT